MYYWASPNPKGVIIYEGVGRCPTNAWEGFTGCYQQGWAMPNNTSNNTFGNQFV